jgi:hypothetical protein
MDSSFFQNYLNTVQDQNLNSFDYPKETSYEDIAGLQPLPLQRMLQQIGRPFTQLYNIIEKAKKSPYPYSKGEIKNLLKPNPGRTQTVLGRAEAVEKTRQNWDPLEAQWKEQSNRLNPSPKSRPSQASFETFTNVVRNVSDNAFQQLNKNPGSMYGILGDISDYLNNNQVEVIRKGVQEQLKQGVDPSQIINFGSGGNKNTGRGNVRTAIEGIVSDLKGPMPGSETVKKTTPQQWLDRYMTQTELPLIVPGVENQFKGI